MKNIIKHLKPHPVVIVVVVVLVLVVSLLGYTTSIKREVEFKFLDYITFRASD